MKCNDCDREHDPAFTMDFTDVEPGAYIYWCDVCGPEANAMNDALQETFEIDPDFAGKLKDELDEGFVACWEYLAK